MTSQHLAMTYRLHGGRPTEGLSNETQRNIATNESEVVTKGKPVS